ncbi:uncharacterized protein DUF2634 [Fontibacillus phaseoli]|uniref:Uncharacterized protein DUF2634 n=1 Tax=Fontibacillus phaseoli TaxID=1416533 RepID=A0A369BQ62_9BACL|nr:DUF2634 domain-containing protein [Fontibacillus phaseoli]RCX22597.1 uncharacterized protein DUF2634 [Fontibacillus phaseoli]
MIPIGSSLTGEMQIVRETSRTYHLDLQRKKIAGFTDGLDAVKQACLKIFQTERFAHIIYDSNYGFESWGLIGRPSGYVRAELKRRITEALLQDDRISEVLDFEIAITGDEAVAGFTVHTIFGDFRTEVNAHG